MNLKNVIRSNLKILEDINIFSCLPIFSDFFTWLEEFLTTNGLSLTIGDLFGLVLACNSFLNLLILSAAIFFLPDCLVSSLVGCFIIFLATKNEIDFIHLNIPSLRIKKKVLTIFRVL